MLFELLWTPEIGLAVNTLVPAFSFMVTLIFFSTLTAYHNLKAVLSGTLAGIICGAIGYTLTQGFPFAIPAEFSYNAIAGMYLFGLVIAVLLSSYTGSRLVLLPIQLIFLMLIVATTSIKTNLGILLGVVAVCIVYFRRFLGILRRNVIILAILLAILTSAIVSNDALVQRLQGGYSRVSVGLAVLQSREDRPGYGGFQYRTAWEAEGLAGWLQNPVFGFGVEAFRSEFGVTSHSTPIDLLYNSGLIGFALFYAVFVSLALRLFRLRSADTGSLGAVIFGTLICYSSITLSATMHYNSYLAAVLAISVQILERCAEREPANRLQS